MGILFSAMNVLITESIRTATASHVQATCGNVTGTVSVMSYGFQVVCNNAANRVWRGGGKFFPTLEKALANYKSGEMRAIINSAVEFSKGQPCATK